MARWKDRIYCYFMGVPYRKTGEQSLKKIAAKITTLDQWETRAATIRRGILKGAGLFPLPKRTPLNAVIHSRREHQGYAVENVFFESVPGFFVAGNLYWPLLENALPSLPAILKPHGHFNEGRFKPDNQYLAATLAQMGAIVFTWDMVGYGESTQVPHKAGHALEFQLWNSTRALDFILSLDKVDKDRIGITGESGGGTQTFFLTAVDDRIRASAPAVMISSTFFGGCSCEDKMPVHKGPKYATNNAEIAGLCAPRPQLIISVGADWTRLVPIREFPFLQKIYALYGAENLIENAHFAREKHDYGPSKRQAAYKFFAKHFHLNCEKLRSPDNIIDESKSMVELKNTMYAFTETHPRPPSVLIGEQEVLRVLQNLQ